MADCLRMSLLAGAVLAVLGRVKGEGRGGEGERVCSLITIYGLKTAECMGFNLSRVPKDLDSDLKTLNLHKNQIARLPDFAFQNYSSLQNLHLVSNRISRIDDNAFQNLRNLQILDLESNQLRAVPKSAFRPLLYLRIVSFNNNPIERIESDDLVFLTQVETLKFENCRLERIDPSAFRPLARLYELNIANNRLKLLDHRLAQSFDSLTVLRLYNNIWHCDCRLRWLRISVQAVPNWDFGPNSPICEAPDLLRGVNWKHLSPEKFACPSVIYSLDSHQNASSVEIVRGSNASIDCLAWGDPEPSIGWTKNGKPVDPRNTAQRVFYSSSSSSSSSSSLEGGVEDKKVRGVLNIVNARKSDEGSYKCVAENSAGRSEVTYKVWTVERRSGSEVVENPRGARIILTYEVVLGVILGCVLLLGCLLVCLVCVVSRRQRARKIVKRRKSNKKHKRQQQLLDDQKRVVDFASDSKNSSSCDQLIGGSFDFDADKSSCQLRDPAVVSSDGRDETEAREEKRSPRRAGGDGELERKTSSSSRKSFFSSRKKTDRRRSDASPRPDILSNQNLTCPRTDCGPLGRRSDKTPPPPPHLPSTTGKESKRVDDSRRPQAKAGKVKVTQFSSTANSSNHCNNPVCNKPTLKSLSARSESETQKSKIPNSDRVPLKKILKTPSASFDKNAREDHASSASPGGPAHVVVKSNRPPDIYATLPARSKINEQVDKQPPQPPKAIGREERFHRDPMEPHSSTPARNIEHLLVFDPPPASDGPAPPFHLNQSRFPPVISGPIRSSFHHETPPVVSSPPVSSQGGRDSTLASRRYRNSTTDVRTGPDPYGRNCGINPGWPTLHKRQDASSSTSLHEILTPPFKKSPVVNQKQNRPPVTRKKGDYGTAV